MVFPYLVFPYPLLSTSIKNMRCVGRLMSRTPRDYEKLKEVRRGGSGFRIHCVGIRACLGYGAKGYANTRICSFVRFLGFLFLTSCFSASSENLKRMNRRVLHGRFCGRLDSVEANEQNTDASTLSPEP